MTAMKALTLAVGLALGATAGVALVAPTAVYAAEQQKVGAKVGKPLQAALDAANKKQWDQAVAKLQEAQAVEKKTPFEEYKIDEVLGWVYINQKKYGDAAVVYERTLNSGMMPPEEVDTRVKTVAQLYFQTQKYGKSAEYLNRWLKAHPGDVEMSSLLAQAHYVQNQYKPAMDVANGVISTVEKSGQAPKENIIQVVLSSAYKQEPQDEAAVNAALEKLVRYYPKDEYWEALLGSLARQQNSDRVTLGLYRLMLDTGVLKRSDDYVEMAQMALEQGLPGEAQAIVETGFANKALGADEKSKERHTRLLNTAKTAATADKASLAQLAKEAQKAPSGQSEVGLGQAYLSYGQYQQAIDALQSGIKKGGVKNPDEAQIALGIAYYKAGQKDQARAAFKAVATDSPLSKVASLWSLHASAS